MKNMKVHKDHEPNKSRFKNNYLEEDKVSFRDHKKDIEKKKYRNYENALRSKNVKALLDYDEE